MKMMIVKNNIIMQKRFINGGRNIGISRCPNPKATQSEDDRLVMEDAGRAAVWKDLSVTRATITGAHFFLNDLG